jgi:hypothetical protein
MAGAEWSATCGKSAPISKTLHRRLLNLQLGCPVSDHVQAELAPIRGGGHLPIGAKVHGDVEAPVKRCLLLVAVDAVLRVDRSCYLGKIGCRVSTLKRNLGKHKLDHYIPE